MPTSTVCLALFAHINLARRIFADKHDGEARLHAVLLLQPRDLGRHLGTDGRRDLLSVDDLRSGHPRHFSCFFYR